MFDFGDELVIGNNKIPWLIWIQILVLFLLTLTILLSYFGFSCCFDNADNVVDLITNDSSLSLTSSPLLTCFPTPQANTNEDVEVEVPTRTESNSERDGSSVKDLLSSSQNSELVFHPCRYFEAFLKCFGLGKSFKKSRTRDKEHED